MKKMSKISITTSGSVAWRDLKRHRARQSVVQSFIKEESSLYDAVSVTSTHSTVVLVPKDRNVNSSEQKQVKSRESKNSDQQKCDKKEGDKGKPPKPLILYPSPALRSGHSCQATASAYFFQNFCQPSQIRSNVKGERILEYEFQDLSFWIDDQDSDGGRQIKL